MRGRNHRFPKIGTIDNYRHFWMISVWAAYLILYVIAEKVVTTDYYSVHIVLDDLIPFCEWFVIPYCLWMALLACTAAYLLFWDAENFKRFTAFIGLGFIPVIIFDMIFPNGQDLRPLAFEHHNIATWLVGRIYAADTNTNVFPSMHVIGSVALYAASLYTPAFRRHKLHWVMLPLAILISISTAFIKQHSCADILFALPYSALVWWLVYGVIFKKRKFSQKAERSSESTPELRASSELEQ